MDNWIDINDRWPDEGVSVLVHTLKGMSVASWYNVGNTQWWTLSNICDEYGYEVLLESHDSNHPELAVTHWMPLPNDPT